MSPETECAGGSEEGRMAEQALVIDTTNSDTTPQASIKWLEIAAEQIGCTVRLETEEDRARMLFGPECEDPKALLERSAGRASWFTSSTSKADGQLLRATAERLGGDGRE